MSTGTRAELIRLGVTLLPSLALVVIGCLAVTVDPWWQGLAIGGGIAALLVVLGGLMVAATHGSALHVAAFAALASFVVRIGGAGAAALVIDGKTWSIGAIIGLAGGLLAALALDLWTWSRVARADATLTSAKESARA
ncbi:MAG: hypothetical protein H0W78_05150 [Planctomycetes bacterium]|nr:hypothetical protein [Planctomycetota bacterium]